MVGIEGRGRVLGHKLPGDESHQQYPRNEVKIAWLWTTEGMARYQSWNIMKASEADMPAGMQHGNLDVRLRRRRCRGITRIKHFPVVVVLVSYHALN